MARPRRHRAGAILRTLALLLCAAGLLASPALAGSGLVLKDPGVRGDFPADTYDEEGERVGAATMRLAPLPGGRVRLEASSAIEGSARSAVEAELEPVDGLGLRLLSQRSESHDEQGNSLGHMVIDHVARRATCTRTDDGEPLELTLPEEDRVVNIPLNLLFDPLVRGESDEVEFQLLLCRVGGGRIVDAVARVAETQPTQQGGRIVEIRYEVDLGPLLFRLAAPFMPQLSFWFEDDQPGAWIGHRMPLFSQGPTVLVVRTGFRPTALGVGR